MSFTQRSLRLQLADPLEIELPSLFIASSSTPQTRTSVPGRTERETQERVRWFDIGLKFAGLKVDSADFFGGEISYRKESSPRCQLQRLSEQEVPGTDLQGWLFSSLLNESFFLPVPSPASSLTLTAVPLHSNTAGLSDVDRSSSFPQVPLRGPP